MKLRHVGLVVNNLDLMIDFYKKVFKAEPVSRGILEGREVDDILGLRRVKLEFVKFKTENIDFELIKYTRPRITPVRSRNHIAITVDNIDGAFTRLKTLGFKFFATPKVMKDSGVKMCFGEDIEGNLFEIVEDIKKEQKKDVVIPASQINKKEEKKNV
jgi:catechol 2,3-dioxygenase-like lactoylglutathione lyase family enzyme